MCGEPRLLIGHLTTKLSGRAGQPEYAPASACEANADARALAPAHHGPLQRKLERTRHDTGFAPYRFAPPVPGTNPRTSHTSTPTYGMTVSKANHPVRFTSCQRLICMANDGHENRINTGIEAQG